MSQTWASILYKQGEVSSLGTRETGVPPRSEMALTHPPNDWNYLFFEWSFALHKTDGHNKVIIMWLDLF